MEQIDAGNAQDIREIFHCLAVAIWAVCPRIRHSEDTSKANTGLQITHHEIPRIDTQLSWDVCLDPDAVLAALAKSKVACARHRARDGEAREARAGAQVFAPESGVGKRG